METAFYIAGIALVLIALAISFIGMRSDGFPSARGLRIGVAFVAVVVVATAVLAVRASQHEAAQREHEENVAASGAEEQQTLTNEDAGTPSGGNSSSGGSGGASSGGAGAGDAAAGEQVFADQGCGGCHTLKAAGATGQIGPDLDTALVGKDEDFINTSIVDPSADIAQGYDDGIMPTDFGDKIEPDQLNDLVTFLHDSTAKGNKGSN